MWPHLWPNILILQALKENTYLERDFLDFLALDLERDLFFLDLSLDLDRDLDLLDLSFALDLDRDLDLLGLSLVLDLDRDFDLTTVLELDLKYANS